MAVPFGFSVGDLIAGIGALVTIIKAVRDAGGSAARYQAIVSDLETLNASLSSIQSLRDEQRDREEYAALCAAAESCEDSIKLFVSKIARYQTWLKPGTEGWKASVRKIQWAFCKTKDITEFRQQITQQTSTVCLKILALQVKESLVSRQLQEKCHDMMNGTFEATTDIQLRILRTETVLEHVSSQQLENGKAVQQLVLQNQQLLEANRELGEQNSLLITKILETHRHLLLQNQIPPQVLLQQPIILKCGYSSGWPIHLDFVDSLEAFIAIIKVKYRQRGVSPECLVKIENLEFTLRDGKTRLCLTREWHALFRPGQTVSMSINYFWFVGEDECTRCKFKNESNDRDLIERYNARVLSQIYYS